MKNSKRSIAMKKSWAKRRNSPMREQARKRANSLGDKLPKKDTRCDDMLADFLMLTGPRQVRVEDGMARIGQAINEIRSMVAVPPRAQGNVRRMIATHMLQGMLSSIPITDRTKVKADVWAAKAYEFADALIAAEGT